MHWISDGRIFSVSRTSFDLLKCTKDAAANKCWNDRSHHNAELRNYNISHAIHIKFEHTYRLSSFMTVWICDSITSEVSIDLSKAISEKIW